MTNQQPIAYIDLGVGSMTCDDCVIHVAEVLESVPGVEAGTVDLATAVRATGQYNAFERRRRPASK